MAGKPEQLELSSPSNLSESQKKLVVYLHQTPVTTRVRERVEDGSPNPKIIEIQDTINAMSFVDTDNRHRRFAGVEHLSLPRNPLQPVYLSFRSLDQTGLRMVAEVMAEINLKKLVHAPKPEVVTGIPFAGVGIMREYAKITGLSYVDVLKKDSSDKIVKKSEKPIGEWRKLLLGDDLISTGLSKNPAINEVQNAHFQLEAILVLIDRRRFNPGIAPYNLYYAFHLIEAVHYLATQDLIPPSTFYEVRNYFSRYNPAKHLFDYSASWRTDRS